MNTQLDKVQENKTSSGIREAPQFGNSNNATFQLQDNRPEIKDAFQLRAAADSYVARQSIPIQKNDNNTESVEPDLDVVQRHVIQLHALDNDVLADGSLEDVVARIEGIAQGDISNGPLQERINDLWSRQNALLNLTRSALESESTANDGSEEALRLQGIVSGMTVRLSMAKMSLGFLGLSVPKTVLYQSQVGDHTAQGGDDSE